MTDDSLTFEQRREALVAELREKGIPLPPHVERAFLSVPRHLFVPGVFLDAVYRDQVIVTKRDKDGLPISSSSQPAIMAIMLDALEVREGHNVLEIGGGTGYNAALLAQIVGKERGHVTTVEIDPEVAEAAEAHLARTGYSWVRVVIGDGAEGYPPHSPYDRVIATASVWDIPSAWVRQLKPGGMMVTPIDFAGMQFGAALRKQPDDVLESSELFGLGFISLKGSAAGPTRAVHLGSSAITLFGDESDPIDEAQAHTLMSENYETASLPLSSQDLNYNFGYYLLLHLPPGYQLVTFYVQDGQRAYGLEGQGWGLFSSTSACLVPAGEQWLAHTYGSGDAILALIEAADQWNAAGRPGPERCHLRVTSIGAQVAPPPPTATESREFVRPDHTYTLWME